MSFPNPIPGDRVPSHSFPTALKKLHDRCDFLYARVERAVKAALPSESNWDDRLEHLKMTEDQVFSDIQSGKGVSDLVVKCAAFENELTELASELPENQRPDLSPGKNNPRTIAVLAAETFKAGENIPKEELQEAFLEVFNETHSMAELGAPPLETIIQSLPRRDRGRFEQTSTAARAAGIAVKLKWIDDNFGVNAPPIGKVVGSNQWKDIMQFLINLSPDERARVKCLNFQKVEFRDPNPKINLINHFIEQEVPHIIGLFPNAFKIRIDANLNQLSRFPSAVDQYKIWRTLLEKEQITQLDMPLPLSSLPEIPFIRKLTHVTLRACENLQLQLELLSAHAINLLELEVSTNETELKKIPDNISKLVLLDSPNLQRIESLPNNLRSLQCFGVPMSQLPELPQHLEELELYNCRNLLGLSKPQASIKYFKNFKTD